MAKTLETSFSIGKKRVTVIIDLYFYSESQYKKDFKDFMDFQTKKSEEVTVDSKTGEKNYSGLDWKFWNLKAKDKPISYQEFLTIIQSILPKVIRELLRQRPDIMVSDQNEFKVRFVLFRVSERGWYIESQPEVEVEREKYNEWFNDVESDPVEQAAYLTCGTFLIQTIAAPWIYRKRIDYTYLYRFLTHEFEHHQQRMRKWFIYEEEISERLKREVPKVPNYRLTFLYQTMLNLIFEGTADFVTIENRPTVNFNMEAIRQFRADLDILTTIVGKQKAQVHCDDNLGFKTYTEGAYYCGKIMCFTIELMIAKRMEEDAALKKALLKKGTYRPIKVRLVDKKEFDLNDLNKIMSTENLFYVVNPPEEMHRMAYAEIKACGADFHKFIALYEKACKELGIKESNMVIWNGLLDKLVANNHITFLNA